MDKLWMTSTEASEAYGFKAGYWRTKAIDGVINGKKEGEWLLEVASIETYLHGNKSAVPVVKELSEYDKAKASNELKAESIRKLKLEKEERELLNEKEEREAEATAIIEDAKAEAESMIEDARVKISKAYTDNEALIAHETEMANTDIRYKREALERKQSEIAQAEQAVNKAAKLIVDQDAELTKREQIADSIVNARRNDKLYSKYINEKCRKDFDKWLIKNNKSEGYFE